MASNGSEFLPNFVEYITPLKEGKYVWPKRLFLFGGFAALVVTLFAVIFSYIPMLTPFVPVILIILSFAVWYLSRFVFLEHEYTIVHGEFTVDVIYGRRQRKQVFSAPIRNFVCLAPVNGQAPKTEGVTKEFFFAGQMKKENTWYAVVQGEKGEKFLVYFEMIEKAEKAFRFYKASAFLNR